MILTICATDFKGRKKIIGTIEVLRGQARVINSIDVFEDSLAALVKHGIRYPPYFPLAKFNSTPADGQKFLENIRDMYCFTGVDYTYEFLDSWSPRPVGDMERFKTLLDSKEGRRAVEAAAKAAAAARKTLDDYRKLGDTHTRHFMM